MTDGSRYEILYADKVGVYDAGNVAGIRTRVIKAGDTLEVESYPLLRKVSPAARTELKRRESSEAQKTVNRRNTVKKIRWLLETNFTKDDYHMTLTYDYGFDQRGAQNLKDAHAAYEKNGLPMDDEDVRRDLRNFLKRLRRKNKGAVKYLYTIESTYEPRPEEIDPLPAHYHIHIVLGGIEGLSRDQIEAIWGRGYANCDRLDLSQNGLKALAKYLSKGKKFSQRWGHSIGLKQPEIRITDRAISRHRAEKVAADCMAYGREIFEKIYTGYALTENVEVKYSTFVSGAYIYARMRRRCT